MMLKWNENLKEKNVDFHSKEINQTLLSRYWIGLYNWRNIFSTFINKNVFGSNFEKYLLIYVFF